MSQHSPAQPALFYAPAEFLPYQAHYSAPPVPAETYSSKIFTAFVQAVKIESDPELREKYWVKVRIAEEKRYNAKQIIRVHDMLKKESSEREIQRLRIIYKLPSAFGVETNRQRIFDDTVSSGPPLFFDEYDSMITYKLSNTRLGAGGGGTVDIGLQTTHNASSTNPPSKRVCAIKSISYHDSPDKIWIGFNEANLMDALNGHSHFLKLYTCVNDPDLSRVYIAMEYFHAHDLLSWKQHLTAASTPSLNPEDSSFSFSDPWLCHIALHTLTALDFLHTKMGLIHRDISTKNIMMDQHFRVKIIDLGLVRRIDTPKYMGPVGVRAFMDQQASEKQMWLPSSDIWSLGVVLMHLRWSEEYNFWEGRNDVIIAAWIDVTHRALAKLPGIKGKVGHFLRNCLQEREEKRAAAHQLLLHPWITGLSKHPFSNKSIP